MWLSNVVTLRNFVFIKNKNKNILSLILYFSSFVNLKKKIYFVIMNILTTYAFLLFEKFNLIKYLTVTH